MILQGHKKIPVSEAILHCAAIETGQFKGKSPFQVWSVINRWHRERGFGNGFGYHGLIMPDGLFYSGRPYTMVGAHVIGHNYGTLGFLLIEKRKIYMPRNYPMSEQMWLERNKFDDYYTDAQKEKLRFILRAIPGLTKVSGHNDYAPRLCPGFKVKTSDWL